MNRERRGCGIVNPVLGGRRIWRLWAALAVGILVSVPVNIITQTAWAFFAYLPWLTLIGLAVRWEFSHSPDKMYRTWWP